MAEVIELREERDRLKAENEELRKDAERYRWLRDRADTADWECLSHQLTREIDRRIDSAISKGPKA
jgi:hypothetical protein